MHRFSGCAAALLCFFAFTTSAQAWPAPVHQHFIARVYEKLPAELQQILSSYREELDTVALSRTAVDQPYNCNLHSDQPGTVFEQAETLMSAVLVESRTDGGDMEQIATDLGELAVLIADLHDPLQTDDYAVDEARIRVDYAADTHILIEDTLGFEPNPILWADPQGQLRAAAERTNHFYQQVVTAYQQGSGYEEVRRVTAFCAQQAMNEIYNAWLSLWTRLTTVNRHAIALARNRSTYAPGDTLRLIISGVAAEGTSAAADLYLALTDLEGNLICLNDKQEFVSELTPFRRNWILPQLFQEEVIALPVPESIAGGELTIYALLAEPGTSVTEGSAWISNLALTSVELNPQPQLDLASLSDEAYLLHAVSESGDDAAIPLRRWDLIFTGDYIDNPATAEDEGWTNDIIPGEFNHMLVYLGRDQRAEPWAMEMTSSLGAIGNGTNLRKTRLAEFEPETYAPEAAVTVKDLGVYRSRWAMRLDADQLALVRNHEQELFEQLEQDQQNKLPYQLEFDWSGSPLDLTIQLVDDGRERGAGCTDYWLSLFEESPDFCHF